MSEQSAAKDVAHYQSLVYGNHQLLLRQQSIDNEQKTDQHPTTSKCSNSFSDCKSAKRIKLILHDHRNIISYKGDKLGLEQQLQNETNTVLNNILSTQKYENSDLLNDFYHLKYNHNMNDDPNQFQAFYQYLFDGDNVLKCDINHCQSAQRYYARRRNIASNSYENASDTDIKKVYLLNLIERIHTYFIHSYETHQLRPEEIDYIEKQLNEFKENDDEIQNDKKLELISTVLNNKKHSTRQITDWSDNTENETLSEEICELVNDDKIEMNKNELRNAFIDYQYDKEQLLDELCDIILNGNDENTVISELLIDTLGSIEMEQKQKVYDIIMYKYYKKQDLNNNNFIKLLHTTATNLYPDVKWDGLESIGREYKLTGNVFIKGTDDFKNSTKFAMLFSSINNWEKKKFVKIYTTINKWKPLQPQTFKLKTLETDDDIKELSVENKTEEKRDEKTDIDYIDKGTDTAAIKTFCFLTNANENIALSHLEENEWNLVFATNSYWAQIQSQNNEDTEDQELYDDDSLINKQSHIEDITQNETKDIIYEHGMRFCYSDSQKHDKRYISKQFINLKEEMLNFPQFTITN